MPGLIGIFSSEGTGKVVVADSNVAKMRPEHWGAAGDGTTDDTTEVQAFCTCVENRTRPSKVIFTPGAKYLLSATVNFQMGPDTTVEAEGVNFIFSNNGVGFDLNPAFTAVMPVNDEADTYVIRTLYGRADHSLILMPPKLPALPFKPTISAK